MFIFPPVLPDLCLSVPPHGRKLGDPISQTNTLVILSLGGLASGRVHVQPSSAPPFSSLGDRSTSPERSSPKYEKLLARKANYSPDVDRSKWDALMWKDYNDFRTAAATLPTPLDRSLSDAPNSMSEGRFFLHDFSKCVHTVSALLTDEQICLGFHALGWLVRVLRTLTTLWIGWCT